MYGFNIYEAGTRVNIWLDRWGEWTVRNGHSRSGQIIDAGALATYAIPFNEEDGGKNTLVFRTLTPSAGYALFVNGHLLPLDLTGTGLPTEYAQYSRDRLYRINAYPRTAYEGLCTTYDSN